MKLARTAILFTLSLSLTACANSNISQRSLEGAGIGAAFGAAGGSLAGAPLIGAGVGAVVGGAIGASTSEPINFGPH